jgi:ABC-type Mn2+/Zn2+ transport system permease subunit
MMGLAAFFAISAGVIGLYASRWFNLPSGSAIVITCTGWFILAYAIHYVFQRPGLKSAAITSA